jgi:Tfp pilus assembly protein PilV
VARDAGSGTAGTDDGLTMNRDERDRGESLPESIITVVIIGLFAVTAVLAFTTLISAAVSYRATASIDALLHNDVAEVTAQLQDATPLYSPCATAATYTSGPSTVTFGNEISGYTSTITAVAYWSGTSFGSTCPTLPTTPTPQQITVTVTNTAGTETGSALAVVDDPYTPESPPYDASLYQLAWVQQPTTINSLTPFSPSIQVAVEDVNGHVLTSDWSNMTLSVVPIAMTNGGALVSCTGSEDAGVFTFPTCTLAGGGEYELVASDQGINATSQVFNSIDQLDTPIVTSAAASPTEIGTVVATYTPSANAPAGQIYTGLACLDPETVRDCLTVTPFTTGESIGGLQPGEQYYVTVQADASTDYLDAKGLGVGPVTATLQAQAPAITSVTAPGADGLTVTFTEASQAPSPTFTAEACLDEAMSDGCVTVDDFTSGATINALTANAGYYVTVAMNSQPNYLGATSTVYGRTSVSPTTTVIFNANGGSGSMSNEVSSYGVAEALTLNTLTPPSGDSFTGWNTASTGSGVSYADGATYPFMANVTLDAQWSVVPHVLDLLPRLLMSTPPRAPSSALAPLFPLAASITSGVVSRQTASPGRGQKPDSHSKVGDISDPSGQRYHLGTGPEIKRQPVSRSIFGQPLGSVKETNPVRTPLEEFTTLGPGSPSISTVLSKTRKGGRAK